MSDDKNEIVWAASDRFGGEIEVSSAKVKRTAKSMTIVECHNNYPFGFKTRLNPDDVSASREDAIRALIGRLLVKLDSLENQSKTVRDNIEKAESMLFGDEDVK